MVGCVGIVAASFDPPGVAAAETVAAADVVAGVKAAYKDVQSIRADFTQVRRDAITKAEDKQRGKLSLKRPRKMRFEFTHPKPSLFVTDGQTLWIYNPEIKQVIEQPDLGGGGGMGVLLDDLSRLDEMFIVTLLPEEKGPRPDYVLDLVARQPSAFKSLQLTLSKQKFLLQDLVLTDSMNNVTELHFSSVRLNSDVADSEFTFVAPPGSQVVKAGGP